MRTMLRLKGCWKRGQNLAKRLTVENPNYHKLSQPEIQIGRSRANRESDFYVDPPERAAEFEPFLGNEAAPTPEQQVAAIKHVFALIQDRPPTKSDLDRYEKFLSANIERSGPTAALGGLITAVVTSPEFVFRMEVGMTEPDETRQANALTT